jgi:hypothetical protein
MTKDKFVWYGPINSGAAVGADTAATANNTSGSIVCGKVHAVYVKYNGCAEAGTDVTVTTLGTSPSVPAITILSIENNNTDSLYYPRAQVHTTAGAALTMDGTEILTDKIAVQDKIKVTIAEADAGDTVDVWVALEIG